MQSLPKYARQSFPRSVLIVAIVMATISMLTPHLSAHGQGAQPEATQLPTDASLQATLQTEAAITLTPTPQGISNDPNEANGIIFGGILLVLIVVIGTLSVIRKRSKPDQS